MWTPVACRSSLGLRPLRVVLAGEPLVLFRGEGGAAGALLDRCPHRGVALSLGKVAADGCLECPFHGWRFDIRGRNRGVPLNPDARRETLGAAALPVRELGELIWVFTDPSDPSPPEPVIPASLTSPTVRRCYVTRNWACHWTRAMENMLDSPHLPFVHRRTIGRPLRRRLGPDSRMDITWMPTPWGGTITAGLPGDGVRATLEFYRPNIMVLTIPIPGRHLKIHAAVVPAQAGATRLFVIGSRDFLKSPLLDPLFAATNARIADEDRAVVESAGATEVPPASTERSVATDRATLQFRKYYYEDLRESSAG